MITPDSTLQEIAAAAYQTGLRITVTFEAMPRAVPADRLSAKYGPQGVGWRWYRPWERVRARPGNYHQKDGWERFYITPTYDMEGNAYWNDPRRGFGDLHCLFLEDGATMGDL